MENWLKLSLFLCFFGFLKEIRPSENFYFEYFTGKWWSLSQEKVQQELWPIATYSQLVLLVLMFLATDLFRYKVFIIVLAAAGIACFSLFAWGTSFFQLQIAMVFYGLFFAAEVAYYTYIYAKVPKEYYAQVTSHTRAAILFGHGISGILSQTLVEFQLLDYQQLNYVTIGALVAAIIWAFMLPPVKTSVYFHSQNYTKSTSQGCTDAFRLIKRHFLESYAQWYVIKWSIWWSLSMCGFIHVQQYMQPLWSLIVKGTDSKLYNGLVETVMTTTGFFATLAVGIITVDWRKYGELALCSCSVLSSIFIMISSQAENVFVSYAAYTAFGSAYQFVMAIATSEVAKHILEDSYGLVFGLNTFVAMMLQSLVLSLFVTGDLGWALNPREQHFAYSICHAGIATLFILIAVPKLIKYCYTSTIS